MRAVIEGRGLRVVRSSVVMLIKFGHGFLIARTSWHVQVSTGFDGSTAAFDEWTKCPRALWYVITGSLVSQFVTAIRIAWSDVLLSVILFFLLLLASKLFSFGSKSLFFSECVSLFLLFGFLLKSEAFSLCSNSLFFGFVRQPLSLFLGCCLFLTLDFS